jgi:hypothetical protein
MRENKNIERLFQEKFKDFEVSPPDFVWENIQEKLHPKEKKRRVIPFWFKTVGIAASFLVVISVVFFNLETKSKNNNTNNNVVLTIDTKNNNSNSLNANTNDFKTSESNKNQIQFNSTFSQKTKNQINSNSVVNNSSTNKVSNSSSTPKIKNNSLHFSKKTNTTDGFVNNYKKQTKTTFNHLGSVITTQNNNKNLYENNLKSNDFNDFNFSNKENLNSGLTDKNTFNKFNTTKSNNFNSGLTDLKTFNSSELNSKITTNNIGVIDVTKIEKLNSSEILAFEEVKIDTITLATLTIEENPMEKLLREKEKEKVADEKEKWSKWAVNSYVSPVFFSSFSNGSPLSDEFASNEKVFNNSTSYGVGVAYNLNKRLSIKTGVSNLNLDFDTEDIAFYSSFEDQSKIANTNIERNANGKYLVLKHEKDISKNNVENQILQSSQNSGNLNQKTQYIEVPLEMSYALLNKKLGVSIKGGMSTLFLTENVISIKATDGNMQIGKASNLNEVHFSSNLGLGLSYNIMKNFQLNLEPTLKYQINTFNKNSEDFTPYVIGVNTGISYKF